MAYVILARSGSVTFFFTELIGGTALLAGSWLGMQWLGVAGLGAGFLAAYIVYYQVVWIIVRREIGLVWTRENKRMMLLAVSAASIILVLPLVGLESLRTPLALSFALVAGLLSSYTIWTEIGWWRSSGRLQHNAEK